MSEQTVVSFDSLSRDSSGRNIQFRVDTVNDPYTPNAAVMPLPVPVSDEPAKYYGGVNLFTVSYDDKDKLTSILGSGATFETVVTEDMLAR
ncbi:hypothetical protein Barb6XT_02257 [Bacteroidales bacterium Barb6XT]|nr:hypothetical protein Barb6XT_02257 [Bacteroidales bacterium Barb6XT]